MTINRGQRIVLWIVTFLLTGLTVTAAPFLWTSTTSFADFVLVVLVPAILWTGLLYVDGGIVQRRERLNGQRFLLWLVALTLSFFSLVDGFTEFDSYNGGYSPNSRPFLGVLLAFVGPVLLLGLRVFLIVSYPKAREQSRSATTGDPGTVQRTPKKVLSPAERMARSIGITMIIIGALSFYSVIGIIEIVVGSGLVRLKRSSYGNALTLMKWEIGLSAFIMVAALVFSVLFGTNVIGAGSAVADTYLASRFFGYAVAGFVGLILSIPMLVWLYRPVLKRAYGTSRAY